ncbi:glycosyltransferase [Roseovarius sp. 2305UL8-3]|uniref:glycosyltransferase n=1 Tax=Roseovarius conchicola TaxID=3121636 RepID=UPI003526F079
MSRTATVIIGRNEGARFLACLDSLPKALDPVIYVDSGSTDGSVAAAEARGVTVVTLDTTHPFTAARARNAGLAILPEDVEFVQLIDGDCALREGWVEAALVALRTDPKLAVVCGRRQERHPEASVYNQLCDWEWDTPIGPALACGGDAMMRLAALREVGGYRDDLIAGEEPELCVRLRAAGWGIERLDAPMTWHDAAMTRVGQWWRRSRRAGHAFAEGAALHGGPPERHWVKETRRALVWGAGLPVLILICLFAQPVAALVLALAYPAQVFRMGLRGPWIRALFTMLGKFPEAQGAIGFYLSRALGRKRGIVEYK